MIDCPSPKSQESGELPDIPPSNLKSSLLVNISQHSSFERDPHLDYHPSLSANSTVSSVPLQEDSGLGESSPSPEDSSLNISPQVRIVPDSQSIPGSSSYILTSSETYTDSATSSSYRTLQSTHASASFDQATGFLSKDETSHIESAEGSSGFYVAESPEYASRFRRSRSVPTKSSTGLSSSLQDQVTPLPVIERSHSGTSLLVSNYEFDHLQKSKGQPRADYRLSSEQGEPFSHTQHQRPVQARSTPSAIQQLSQNLTHPAPHNFATLQRPLRTGSASFVVLEDCVADSQPIQITESSVLSQRHPNSQPDRVSRSRTGLDNNESYNLSSDSLDFGTISGVPTLESRTPPRAPSPRDMSQHSSTQINAPLRASSELPRSGLRQRLKDLRAGSRVEADSRRLGRRSADQSQPASPANELAMRSNLSLSSGGAIASDAPVHSSTAEPRWSAPVVKTPTVLNAQDAPTRTTAPASETVEASSTNTIATSNTANASVSSLERQASEQSRVGTQRSEVPANVPLPLGFSQQEDVDAKSSSAQPLSEDMSSFSQVVTALRPTHQGPMEFIIPLGMNPRVRDHYISIMHYYRRAIEESQKERISKDALKPIELMLDRLDRVTTHLDLDNGEGPTQEDVPAEDLAKWAVNCSEKFRFLHHILERLRDSDKHVAIVAKSGQLLDILETFLKGRQVTYNRPEVLRKSSLKDARGRLEVTLLPSGVEGSTSLPCGANLVIALDGSFNAHDPQVVKLRAHATNVGQLAPVTHLMIYHSAEHIERCIPTTLDPIDRVRRIVSCLTQAGDEVGQLLPDEGSPAAAAEEVAAFVEAGGLAHDWTFPSIRPIDGIVAIEYTQGLDALSQAGPITGQRVIAPATSLKRALVGQENRDLWF